VLPPSFAGASHENVTFPLAGEEAARARAAPGAVAAGVDGAGVDGAGVADGSEQDDRVHEAVQCRPRSGLLVLQRLPGDVELGPVAPREGDAVTQLHRADVQVVHLARTALVRVRLIVQHGRLTGLHDMGVHLDEAARPQLREPPQHPLTDEVTAAGTARDQRCGVRVAVGEVDDDAVVVAHCIEQDDRVRQGVENGANASLMGVVPPGHDSSLGRETA
jgi:hypothetical protein